MSFERSGLNGAIPKFWPHGESSRRDHLKDLIEYERTYRDDFTVINHPDAIALVHSWQDREDLLELISDLQSRLDESVAHNAK